MKRLLIIFVALAGAASLAAGASSFTGVAATVSTGSSSLGRILVDGQGRTLYLFEKDTRRRSACSGACATYWPPLLTRGKPTVGRGARASLLGTIRRSNGTTQVTYAGHPLYRYLPDTKPGQTKGQDSHTFGAGWYVLSPAGKKIEADMVRQLPHFDPDLEQTPSETVLLHGTDFFDADAHPLIVFRSTSIELGDDRSAVVAGELQIGGVSHPVTATGTYAPTITDPFGVSRAALDLSATVDRRDWEMSWQLPLPDGGDALGWEVEISAGLELVKEDA